MKYSFIIPSFNCEKYIENCIMSIISQNSNVPYEVIIVDDGSTDSTELIINNLLLKYPNVIKYFKQINQGVSIARNNGIKKSKGEYIIFVDSDDEIFDNFFSNLEKVIGNNSYDVIKTKVKCIENKKYDNRFEVPVFAKKTGIKALCEFCDSNKIFATPWSYIFKRDFIVKEKLFFKKNTTHEDYLLIPMILSKAHSITSTDWFGYKYIKRKNSMSTSFDNVNETIRINDFINNTNELIKYFKKNFNDNSKKICYYFYNRMTIKITHVNLNVKLNMNLLILDKIEKTINNLFNIIDINDLPNEYAETIKKALNDSKTIFENDLISVILGGSCGKNNPVVGWSDIDLYIILKSYESHKVKLFSSIIEKYNIHIGVTFYSLTEIENDVIDNKTKIMLYEKQKFRVNPTLYGYCPFRKINYTKVVLNDKNNLPNVLHEFRRMYIKLLSSKNSVDKKYIKKLLLLIKCYFNIKGVFLYGYENVICEFLKIYNIKEINSTKTYFFDIMRTLNDTQSSKKEVIDFSSRVLDFIIKEMREF